MIRKDNGLVGQRQSWFAEPHSRTPPIGGGANHRGQPHYVNDARSGNKQVAQPLVSARPNGEPLFDLAFLYFRLL